MASSGLAEAEPGRGRRRRDADRAARPYGRQRSRRRHPRSMVGTGAKNQSERGVLGAARRHGRSGSARALAERRSSDAHLRRALQPALAAAGARLGMSVTVTLADGAPALARVPARRGFRSWRGAQRVDRRSRLRRGEGQPRSSSPIPTREFAYLSEGAPEGAKIVALGVHKIDAHEKVRIVDNARGAVMRDFNLSLWGLKHPQLIAFLILVIAACGRVRLCALGPRGRSVLHHQERRRLRHLAGRDRQRDAGPGRRPDRAQAAGAAMDRQGRNLFQARLRRDFVPVQGLDSSARGSRTCSAIAQEDERREGRPAGRRHRSQHQRRIRRRRFGALYDHRRRRFYAELKDVAKALRKRLQRVADVEQVDLYGDQGERIFVEFSHAKLAMLGVPISALLDSLAKQNALTAAGEFQTARTARAAARLRRARRRSGGRGNSGVRRRPHVPLGRHRDRHPRLRRPAFLSHPRQRSARARNRRRDAERRQHPRARQGA